MAWIKIENEIVMHPKILQAGNEACGAWVRMIAYCNAKLTDGRVPASVALEIAGSKRVLKRLVEARLLSKFAIDYEVHDYCDYQTRARAVSERSRKISETRAKAGKLGAQKRWGKQQQESPSVINRNETVTSIRNESAQNPCHRDGKIFSSDGKKMANADGKSMAKLDGKSMAKPSQPIETTLPDDSDCDGKAMAKLKSRIFSRLKQKSSTFDFEAIETPVEDDSRKVRAHEQEHEEFSIITPYVTTQKPVKNWRHGKMAKNIRIHEYAKQACDLGGASRAAVEPAWQANSAVSVHAAESARTNGLSNETHQANSTVAGGAQPKSQSSELDTSGALRRSDLDLSSDLGASPEACRREKAPAAATETRLGTEAMHAPGPGAQSGLNRNFESLGHSTERTLGVARVEELLVNAGLTCMSPRWATRAQAMAPFSPDEIRRALITAYAESHAQRPNPGFVVAILERWRAEQTLPPKVPAPDSEWARARAREAEQRRRETGQPRQPAAPPAPKPQPVSEPPPEITEEQREKNLKFMKELMKQLNNKKGF